MPNATKENFFLFPYRIVLHILGQVCYKVRWIKCRTRHLTNELK